MISDELKEERKKMVKLAKQERNKKTYEKTLSTCMTCDVCAIKVNKYYWKTHIETTRHKKWCELKKTQI